MKDYIGTKMIQAKPMTRGDYNKYRGWQIPADENPEDEGYLVKYKDGYESWSPKEVFEEAYRESAGLTFGVALELLKRGEKVARIGWNGKGMYLFYVPGKKYYICDGELERMAAGVDEYVEMRDSLPRPDYLPYIAMKTTDNKCVPWLASQTDMLAEDWLIVG